MAAPILSRADIACSCVAHAVSTYRQFIIENEATLKQLPAPRIAQQYYLSDDPYLYNMDSALCRGPVESEPRRPLCDNLYDVFVNILEDEWVRFTPIFSWCNQIPQWPDNAIDLRHMLTSWLPSSSRAQHQHDLYGRAGDFW